MWKPSWKRIRCSSVPMTMTKRRRAPPSRKGPRPKAARAARAVKRPQPPPTGSARTWRPAAAPWKRGLAPNSKMFSRTTAARKARSRKCRRRPIRNGPAWAPAAARTAPTIWKLSSPPKLRSPLTSPSRWRWRFPIRPAVCAGNLTECLAIQLKDRDRFDPAMRTLVEHLDLLAKRDLAALRRLCGVNEEDLADMIAEIRHLNPKPGLAFGSTLVQPIVPDVYVRAASNGTWQVELNSDTLPKVLISQRYFTQVSKTTRSDKDKTYLADCLQTATWLVRALDQRAKTILKVSSELVRQQDAFFAKGVQHLRPLNLKTVAAAISMHESTVSRVTANKYMATSRGIFELKYFFTSSIASADGGEAHSAEAVR